MNESFWLDFYRSELQHLWMLLVVPTSFLAYRAVGSPDKNRGAVPAASGFVACLTLVFAVETMVDPLSTGPLVRALGIKDTLGHSLIMFLFVYLGDLRVLWLAEGVAHPERGFWGSLPAAAKRSLIVPIGAGLGYATIRGIGGLLETPVHGQVLWILYEAGFLALCVYLGRRWVDTQAESEAGRAYLRSLFGFSAAYYALWLAADFVILIGGLDLGWALRIVPNQLYYGFWVVFAYARFYSVGGPEPSS